MGRVGVSVGAVFALLCAVFIASALSAETEAQGSAGSQARIAFTSFRDGNGEIYVMNAGGSGQRNLTRNKADDDSPAWSPDGREIAFTSNRDGNEEIYVMNAGGSGQRNLTRNKADDYAPVWSPDGRRIAFTRVPHGGYEGNAYVMNSDGSSQRRLTRSLLHDDSPVWSPDGKQIAYTSERGGKANTRDDGVIGVVNADGSDKRTLTGRLRSSYGPAWSPDGRKIVFVSDNNSDKQKVLYGDQDRVYVMNADGSAKRNLTGKLCGIPPFGPRACPSGEPAWSPDGRKIVFVNESNVYVMNADGSGKRNLTRVAELSPVNLGGPAWSPDGRQIAFVYYDNRDGIHGDDDFEVYVMNADGSGQRNLTRTPTSYEQGFAWSPALPRKG